MTERLEHVQKMAGFCGGLAQVLRKRGADGEQTSELFRLGISAECVQCGIRVAGEELFNLAQPGDPNDHQKIKRLRLGDCARYGCDSCYYRIRFWPVASLDWSSLLSEMEAPQEETVASNRAKTSLSTFRTYFFVPSPRMWMALGVLVLLLVIRQWHLGGRIPLLREPEHFRVDLEPQESQEVQGPH